jgi:HK97 family phage major capsid protein
MKITTPMNITAADSNSRTISGRIVAFEEAANASTGKVVFAKGSISPAPVKLNLEHDRTRPIGKSLEMELDESTNSINATFKITNTTAGTDALTEAMDGLRDGFSIELAVDDYIMQKDGTMRVLAGELTGVALVTEPAVRSARVSEVAATEGEEVAEEISDSTVEEEVTPTTEGDEVDNTVTNAETVETVEAAQSTTAAAKPIVGGSFTKPRLEFTAAKYVENTIRAAMGDDQARQYILAADNTTDNAGLVPTRQMAEVVNGLSTSIRPSIDAISRGTLPDAGMSFEIPKITQAPTVAVTAEEGTPSDTDQNSAFITVDVKKFAGQQTFSVELLDRTSPAFFDELIRNMAAAKAKAENAYVNAALISGATADGTTTSTYPTAAELLGIVSRGAASVYAATAGLPRPFAKSLIASTGQWANLMSLNVDGRPIYNASQPQNAGGVVRPDSLMGNVAGLDLFVDPTNAGDGDGTLLVVNPDAYTWYEGPTFRLRADVIASGQITVGYYGYGALATKIAAGAFKNNKA